MLKMKRKLACSLMAVAVIAAVILLSLLVRRYTDKPILKHALQGGGIVTAIEQEFEIPIDPLMDRPGVFCENWLYWRGFDWNAGSQIIVCGVHDEKTQKRIVELVEREVKARKLCDVVVIFFGDTKIEKNG